MSSNYFECCPRVNPSDSVPEALSNIIIYNKKQDDEIAKKANKDALSEVAKSGRYYDLIDKPVALPNPKPITINGQRYDGSEAVTVTVSSEGGGTPVEIDDTLTHSGKAADAKATGDALNALNGANAAQDTEIAKKVNDAELAKVAKSGSYTDLTNKPEIPTVPSALPNPNALTFTGAVNETYDGSAAKSVSIPTIPESLKNPNKLILSGAVTAEYDGSAPVSVEIPAGGSGSYTLPIASPTTLGGVMPAAKTDEMTQAVGVDEAGGLWTAPGGGSGKEQFKVIGQSVATEEVSSIFVTLPKPACEYKKVYIYITANKSNTNTGSSNPSLVLKKDSEKLLSESVNFSWAIQSNGANRTTILQFDLSHENNVYMRYDTYNGAGEKFIASVMGQGLIKRPTSIKNTNNIEVKLPVNFVFGIGSSIVVEAVE